MKSKVLRKVLTGCLTMSCLFTLNACAKKTEYVLLEPPSVLLLDCKRPTTSQIGVTKNLREYSLAVTELNAQYNAALDSCNADKMALRAWYKEMREAKKK